MTEDRTVAFVLRGLLHELANLATAFDGATAALRRDGTAGDAEALEDLSRSTDRSFAVHARMRALVADHAPAEALDPRALAADVADLLVWHSDRPCRVILEDGPAPPVFGEAWRLRCQLLAACDEAAGRAEEFRFSFRADEDVLTAVSSGGRAIWSAPLLSAARRPPRDGGG